MRVRITWGHITEGALIDFLKQGFFIQRTPFRPNSLWLRNPKYYPRASFDFSSYVIDNVPDEKIAEFLTISKELKRKCGAGVDLSSAPVKCALKAFARRPRRPDESMRIAKGDF